MGQFRQNVLAGGKYLDATDPDWFNTINLDVLDLVECDVCILGQLDSDFYLEQERRCLTYEECNALGFFLGDGSYDGEDDGTDSNKWAELTNEWTDYILERRYSQDK